MTLREKIIAYISEIYHTEVEYPWEKDSESAVFRHADSRKWFCLLMSVSKEKLGLDESGKVWLINLKCDPLMIGALQKEKGVLPAYHMNKEHWISILLDGSVPKEKICSLIDLSFSLTKQ